MYHYKINFIHVINSKKSNIKLVDLNNLQMKEQVPESDREMNRVPGSDGETKETHGAVQQTM